MLLITIYIVHISVFLQTHNNFDYTLIYVDKQLATPVVEDRNLLLETWIIGISCVTVT